MVTLNVKESPFEGPWIAWTTWIIKSTPLFSTDSHHQLLK